MKYKMRLDADQIMSKSKHSVSFHLELCGCMGPCHLYTHFTFIACKIESYQLSWVAEVSFNMSVFKPLMKHVEVP